MGDVLDVGAGQRGHAGMIRGPDGTPVVPVTGRRGAVPGDGGRGWS